MSSYFYANYSSKNQLQTLKKQARDARDWLRFTPVPSQKPRGERSLVTACENSQHFETAGA
jgi:hypothetical protein